MVLRGSPLPCGLEIDHPKQYTTEYQAAFSLSELSDDFDGDCGEGPDRFLFSILGAYSVQSNISSAKDLPHSNEVHST